MAAVLSCWKEIAAYLGRGVRTVQRWERELGLPVRRPWPGKRQIVFAFPAELDAWIRQQSVPTSAPVDIADWKHKRVIQKQLPLAQKRTRQALRRSGTGQSTSMADDEHR